jgi:GNAT superfamily N-acetyltransferase
MAITTESERIERDVHRDLQRAAPRTAVDASGIEVFELAGAVCTCMRSEPSLAAWNRVVGLGVDEPVTPRILDRVERFYADRGAGFSVQGAVAGLEGRGYVREPGAAVFERPVERVDLAESPLAVVDAADGEQFGAVCAAASGLPQVFAAWFAALVGRDRWHCFVACDGHAAVATGVLYVGEMVGCFGFAATLERHRGRGAQRALLAARLVRAHQLGLATVVASTGETVRDRPSASYRNLERTGFRLVGSRPNWRHIAG